ncbi:hypothetical protein AB3X52_18000 [Nocardioides sp. DS6]|uniref:Uncharacterized protein n=1 Tax=Nocardioides eburneus TaxID=3231482 RepID=A0ABV3T2T4_9ACTN
MALPAPTRPALQAARGEDGGSPVLTYFAKAGLGVRVGTRWRLSVADDAREHLRIGWGAPAVPTTAIGPAPGSGCRSASRSGWLWYPGGYWTDEPGCYSVVVHAAGRLQQVPIGVGAPCPGQRPPVDTSAR